MPQKNILFLSHIFASNKIIFSIRCFCRSDFKVSDFLGGIFDSSTNETLIAFNYAIEHVNNHSEDPASFPVKLTATTHEIDYEIMNLFNVSQTLCATLKVNKIFFFF